MVKVPGISEPGATARTYLGIQLLPSIRFFGRVEGVSGNTVSFQDLDDHTSFVDPIRPSYLHVLDGSGRGFITDIVGFQPGGFVCAEDPGPWLQFGDQIILRSHSNLSDIFGVSNTFVLSTGETAETADNVVIWDAATQQEKVYCFHSTRNRWEERNIAADAGAASIRFPQGLYVVRRSPGMLRIMLSGDIGSEAVLLPVRPGAAVFSLPVNLTGSLDAMVKSTGNFAVESGINASSADILTFEEPVTGQQRGPFYHFNSTGSSGWREVGVDGGNAANQPLDFLSTLVFRRNGGPGRVLIEGSLEPPLVPRPPLPPNPEPGEVSLMGEFPYPINPDLYLTFRVEISTDLQNWTYSSEVSQTLDNRLLFPLPVGQGRAFYRLAVSSE